MKEPSIRSLKTNERIFHDSFLKNVNFNKDLSVLEIDLECDYYGHSLWRIIFKGVLKFEFESLGTGITLIEPVDIYEVFLDHSSEETLRWKNRLGVLEVESEIYHVVLCSSYIRGLLHDNKDMEGIQIICRDIEILKVY